MRIKLFDFVIRFFNTSPKINTASGLQKSIHELFGFIINDHKLFEIAFTHKSVSKTAENELAGPDNERLEYLGDAVFGLAVSEFLFKKFPGKSEGFLTDMRAKIVSRNSLNELAFLTGIDQLIQFDKSVIMAQDTPKSLYGNAFEAFIGAIYLDKGFNFSKNIIIKKIINAHIDIQQLKNKEHNFKSRILEWAQQKKRELKFVTYEVKEGENKVFKSEVQVDGEQYGEGRGKQKISAEQQAAKVAYKNLMGQ